MRDVADILKSKAQKFNFIAPDALVIDALTMLNSVNLSYLIVKDVDEYKGIFCERDYSRNVILKGRSSHTTKVSEIMTIDLPIVHMEDSVEHCMSTMNLYKTRYLLAYDDDENFRGVITIHDLLRQVLAGKGTVNDTTLAGKLLDQEEERIY
jgi:CBS domain-containing protein